MEVSSGKHVFKSDISEAIEQLSSNECSKQVLDSLKSISKKLYDHLHRDNSLTALKAKSFRKLLIDGFDAEQIFQQIELQNKSALSHFSHVVNVINDSKYVKSKVDYEDVELSCDKEERKIQNIHKSHFSSGKEEYIFDDDSDSSLEDIDTTKLKLSSIKKRKRVDESNISSSYERDNALESYGESEEDYNDSSSKTSKRKKVRFQEKNRTKFKSVVDDQFFKLSDLEEFLKVEDLRAEDKLQELNEDDEDIDHYQDISSEDLDESENEIENDIEERKTSKNIMYDDFFDAPDSGEESAMDENELLGEEHVDEINSDIEDDKGGVKDSETMNENLQVSASKDSTFQLSKTPFELEQEKIKKTISSYEESLIQKPDWHLTGEVAASSRPKDSLLHQETDFDVNAKPVLVEDKTLCEKAEKAIKTIIKNKAFSDGQRKYKTNNDIIALKKEIVLDQAKSKKSLAEVYEDQYLKKKYGEQHQEDPKHAEIKKMMDSILPELQALFCHIPKPAIPDIKIVSNLPAITVEEVAPVSISDVTLLAPEEVKKKSGLIKGHSERTDTDRKRERRKKKIHQKKKFQKEENGGSTEKPQSAAIRKQEKLNTLKKLKQHRNTKMADMGGEKIKSSKDFFSRLQDTVNSKVQPAQSKKRK